MSTVAVLQFDGSGACRQSKKLMAQADAHDRHLAGLHELSEVVNCVLAMRRITRSIGDENSVEMVGDLMDRIVVGEAGDRSAAANEASQNVFFDAAINDSDVGVASTRADMEGGLGADFRDEIDLFRVNESLILIRIILLPDCDSCEGGTLFPQVSDYRASIDTGHSRHAFLGAPLAQALDSCPMAVLFGNIRHYYTGRLQVGRFKISK